jgi:hypothetical protein
MKFIKNNNKELLQSSGIGLKNIIVNRLYSIHFNLFIYLLRNSKRTIKNKRIKKNFLN